MLKRLIPARIRRVLLRMVSARAVREAKEAVLQPFKKRGPKHRLDGELIVSLTSYPPRFAQLHLTLRSLLHQDVTPDRVILWIAHDDMKLLPSSVLDLAEQGLQIAGSDDIKSFKKLLPAITTYPDAYIVTADDDTYYPPDWLSGFANEAKNGDGAILCRRAHRLITGPNGRIRPYRKRENDVQDDESRIPSHDLLFTGCGGVLYPPRSLHPQVTDREMFERLCPHGDDLWFAWCASLRGTPVRKFGGKFRSLTWDGTADTGLWVENEMGRNDEMLTALQNEFGDGWPTRRSV